GPEPNFKQLVILPVLEFHIQSAHQARNDIGAHIVEHVLKKPPQAYRFIKGRRLILADERRFSQLTKEEVDVFELVFANHLFEVVDDREHVSGIELCWVRRQYYAHAELFQFLFKLFFSILRFGADKQRAY